MSLPGGEVGGGEDEGLGGGEGGGCGGKVVRQELEVIATSHLNFGTYFGGGDGDDAIHGYELPPRAP